MTRPDGPAAPAGAAYPPMPPEPEASDVAWRRLDQRMLLVQPVQELVRGAVPLVVILFTGFGDPVRNAITAAGALALIAWGVVKYATTSFRVTAQQVQIRRGLLTKKLSVAPLDRVRTVDVTAPPLHRLLGLGRVVIGTGRTDTRRQHDLLLDGMALAGAEQLRAELLHRSPVVPTGADAGSAAVPEAAEQELVRLRYAWLRYAPFTLSGAVTALVIFGIGSRIVNEARLDPTRFALTRDTIRALERSPLWVDVVEIVVVVVLVVAVLSVAGYVLAFHGFRLTRRPDGTLHVTRGLLTRRETTLEHRRVRGVELSEPLLLRAVGGARLIAIATGLRVGRGAERGGSVLTPPSPHAVDVAVGGDIVGDPSALTTPLTGHGPAAHRRRLTRAVVPTALVVAALGGLALGGVTPAWSGWAALALLPLAAALGLDRSRALGHRVGGPLVVSRYGSLVRRRQVFAAEGVIGATVRSSPFQRRAGVVTLELTTAAGRQHYPLTDLASADAWTVVRRVLPEGTLPPAA